MKRQTSLTALESSFLAMERCGLPMHVGALIVVEGAAPVTMRELRSTVAARLRRLPKFRQTVRPTTLGLARAKWERASRVDLDSHVIHHRLPAPGRTSQLFALCGQIHQDMLPRDRPLWEMHLIDGLEDGRQALLLKTHHAITDGLAGVELSQVLFDRAHAARRRVELPPTRFAHRAAASALTAAQDLLGLAFTVAAGPLALNGPFNGPVGPHRNFGAVGLPMEGILRIKRQLGGTVDDVVVALVAAGLRRYLLQVRYPEIPRGLRAMLPVSTRAAWQKTGLGNHVTAVFVDLPMDTDELPDLVRRIAASKAVLRTAHAAEGASLAIEAVGLLPNPIHESVLRLASQLPFANLVVSDVPGLHETLYLCGRRIVACYPMMPLGRNVGLSIAALSMDGVMGIGVTSDPGLVPSAQRLAAAIEEVLAHYEQSHRQRNIGGVPRAA